MIRRAILLALACGCASGCASGGASTQGSDLARQPVIYSSPETGTIVGERARAAIAAIAAPPATVWLAVKKTYLDLDIPITVENPAGHQIGNDNFQKTRQMAGQSMTNWVDCGSSMTGQKASTYRIYSSLITNVIPDGKGGTSVHVIFVPMGQDVTEGGSDRIACGSTGRFEQLILAKVQETVGKA
jgi:hypothetical protein